jgi:hypothetical protein
VVIALVVAPEGLPMTYKVMTGNTNDSRTLREFLSRVEPLYVTLAVLNATDSHPALRRRPDAGLNESDLQQAADFIDVSHFG